MDGFTVDAFVISKQMKKVRYSYTETNRTDFALEKSWALEDEVPFQKTGVSEVSFCGCAWMFSLILWEVIEQVCIVCQWIHEHLGCA